MKIKKLIVTSLLTLTCSIDGFSQEEAGAKAPQNENQDKEVKQFVGDLIKTADDFYNLKASLEPIDEKVDMAEKYIQEKLRFFAGQGVLEVYLGVALIAIDLELEREKVGVPKDAVFIDGIELGKKVFGHHFPIFLKFESEANFNFLAPYMKEFEIKLVSRLKKYRCDHLRFKQAGSRDFMNIYKFTLVLSFIEEYTKNHPFEKGSVVDEQFFVGSSEEEEHSFRSSDSE